MREAYEKGTQKRKICREKTMKDMEGNEGGARVGVGETFRF